jgi:ankyrin repeat protein
MFAIRAGDLESVRLLLDAGVDVNAPASDGTRLLQFAIVNARFDVAKYLIERGAEVTTDRHGTPLQLLSFLRRADSTAVASVIARQLPEVGVDAFELGRVLIAHGDNVNARYQSAGAPPHTAFGAFNFELRGATPFFIATVTGDVPWMRFLAANGADPRITNVANITPLLGAAGIGYMPGITPGTNAEVFEAVKLAAELGNDPAQMIEGGEKPDARWQGATAMHGAAIRNSPEMVSWLVDRGLAIDAKTERGLTPYQIAAHNGAGQLYGNMLFIHSPDVADRLVKIAKERGQTIDTTSPVVLTPVRR